LNTNITKTYIGKIDNIDKESDLVRIVTTKGRLIYFPLSPFYEGFISVDVLIKIEVVE